MIKNDNNQNLAIDEMIDCLRNPTLDKRSLAELDTVIDEIIERNPDFVQQIIEIVSKSRQ